MTQTQLHRPVVGVLACRKCVDPLWSHAVAEKYLCALDDVADVMPLIVPSLLHSLDIDLLLERLDGLLLPGSVSNIEPHHYNNPPVDDTDPRDRHRDSAALSLIKAAVRLRVPVLGICRGFQEINVALGGTLHQRVQEVHEKLDHREPQDRPLEEQFDLAHEVILEEGGLLYSLIGEKRVKVNSLHWQGIETLGKDLVIEARATDGLIEAFRHVSKETLIMGVQWHPEWQTRDSRFYTTIFDCFGNACRESRDRREMYA